MTDIIDKLMTIDPWMALIVFVTGAFFGAIGAMIWRDIPLFWRWLRDLWKR